MADMNDSEAVEATREQLTMPRELGVAESELEEMSFAEAEEWIAELRAQREDAGRIGGE